MPQNIQCAQVLQMATPAHSDIKKNVVSYMAGYLRYPVETCDQCHDLLMIEKFPEPSSVSQYELLRFKTFNKLPCISRHCLLRLVQSIEDLFCALFGGVMYEKDLLKTLCSNVGNEM